MTDDAGEISRAIGRQHMIPAAGAAARAVFAACGGAPGWPHWTTPHGEHVRVVMAAFASVLEAQPDAPAEALYLAAARYGWHGAEPCAWTDLPASVRAAHRAFRAVYLDMAGQVAEAEREDLRAERPQRASERAVSPTGRPALGAEPADGCPPDSQKAEIVLLSRDPSRRKPRSEGAKIAGRVHDARQALKRAELAKQRGE
jgi:hypothetical protein